MRISDWSSDVCSSDLFTDLPVDEIARLESLEGAEINEAKIILANEATAMCRGREAAEAAAETARKTDRKSVVQGKSVSVSVDHRGSGIIKKNTCRNR